MLVKPLQDVWTDETRSPSSTSSALALIAVSVVFLKMLFLFIFCYISAVFKKVKKTKKVLQKNKTERPHLMFCFLTFTVYINTYINILHGKPNLEKEKTKMEKSRGKLLRGLRENWSGGCLSVHFMLEAGQCGHRFGRLCGEQYKQRGQLAQYGELL